MVRAPAGEALRVDSRQWRKEREEEREERKRWRERERLVVVGKDDKVVGREMRPPMGNKKREDIVPVVGFNRE